MKNNSNGFSEDDYSGSFSERWRALLLCPIRSQSSSSFIILPVTVLWKIFKTNNNIQSKYSIFSYLRFQVNIALPYCFFAARCQSQHQAVVIVVVAIYKYNAMVCMQRKRWSNHAKSSRTKSKTHSKPIHTLWPVLEIVCSCQADEKVEFMRKSRRNATTTSGNITRRSK